MTGKVVSAQRIYKKLFSGTCVVMLYFGGFTSGAWHVRGKALLHEAKDQERNQAPASPRSPPPPPKLENPDNTEKTPANTTKAPLSRFWPWMLCPSQTTIDRGHH